MPVPTDTFRNMKTLNLLFALAAVVLLIGTVMLVLADYNRTWRQYQRAGNAWMVAMTTDAARDADNAQTRQELAQLSAQKADLQASLPHEQIAKLQADYAQAQEAKKKLDLKAAVKKGEIGPLTQQIERRTLAEGADSPAVRELVRQRAAIEADFNTDAAAIAAAEAAMAEALAAIEAKKAEVAAIQKQIDGIDRKVGAIQEKLSQLNPQGLAKVGKFVRDAPLLDWFNPTEKVQQVVVPEVRTDLNFLTVETIDRCQTCHINIDNPAFEENNLLLFAERQLAQAQGQNVDAIHHPVVLRSFWEEAATLAGLDKGLENARAEAARAVNAYRSGKGDKPIAADALDAEFDQIAIYSGDDRAARYKALAYYLTDIKKLLRDTLGESGFDQLRGLYRHELVEAYNAARGEQGLPALSANSVLLGHPRLDLYVDPESAHPMKLVGCTSCHEGAGQETQFEHTAHTPRDIWVDAATGAPVPSALLKQQAAHGKAAAGATTQALQLASSAKAGDAVEVAVAHADAHAHGDGVTVVQQDINLADPHDPAPFAPAHGAHGSAAFTIPGRGTTATAVTQEAYWKKAYGWHHIHYMHWEKPMHSLEYVESSCNRCHTNVFDVKAEAPRLYEGRKLFVQQGCAGCHAVTEVLDDADFKLMGPSLVHVKHKLSHEMMASWIWSPKAFRPMTRMPHFFMLENNSTPADILRTRVETTAITHYLLKAEPKSEYYAKAGKPFPTYQPEAPPELPADMTDEKKAESVARGRIIFNNVGCLGCHTNMAEHGEQWIVGDLMERKGLSKDQAKSEYDAMGEGQPDDGYNARHWYAMEHLRDKITQVGPEMSGVGTKLLAGRTPEQARAWTYDWLRNPRHYSDYTIMPSLRLSETEASDLTAYLLSLQRPGYTPDKFAIGDDEKAMLGKLVTLLDTAGTVSRDPAATDEQLNFVGQKMIAHYGCNGCHVVPGMEDLASACTSLDDWGLKDPHKLDFGYFDHAFDRARQQPFTVHRTEHEGLAADAPHITATSEELETQTVAWESMHALERRPWLYHKLHNSRVYDRGRTQLDGGLDPATGQVNPGKPYDKLKMPKFFLTDDQVHSLVTFVTSIRKPLVSDAVMVGNRLENKMLARGRQTAELFNCYGCHNIEGNGVLVQQYYDVLNPDGSFNYEKLNNAPPRLLGQGSKTQPDWLAYFLSNVHTLRPWLRVRMPSYHWDVHSTEAINDYFASASLSMADSLTGITEPIQGFIDSAPDPKAVTWWNAPALAKQVGRLKAWGLKLDLVRPAQLDTRLAPELDLAKSWNKLLKDVAFLENLNAIEYPFPLTPRPKLTPEEFARGEALYNELRCYQCHALGDEATLAKLHELDTAGQPAAPAPADEGDPYDDGYGDAPAADAKPQAAADDDGYGDDGYGDDGYGDDTPAAKSSALTVDDVLPTVLIGGKLYSAPNLSYTANRLRWDWFHKWLMEPATIQPGTAMPQWFPGGHSAFANFPAAAKERAESLYGYNGQDQMRLLMEYVYAAGIRNYTPGSEKLSGQAPAKVELTPLEKPKPAEGATTEAAAPTGEAPPAAEKEAAVQVPQPKVEAATSSIELHDGTVDHATTRIVGVVSFAGKAARRPVRMDQDPFCVDSHRGGPRVLSDDLIVNDKGELKNAFVYVKSGLGPGPHTIPEDKKQPVLDQHGCLYVPHVLGMVAGQPLTILNSDNTLHNVKMQSGANGSFNEGMPVAGMQMQKPFSNPEMGIKFACNVHPWMSATLHVMEHPYFAVSDIEGRFEITGLPPGTYTLEVVHDKAPAATMSVTVEAGKSVRSDARLGG